ncbi:MAG: 1-acyl-sn-glycerol-3-phosphate acyltransferase [Rhodocyclales bacterium]|nr:1-acyl-sn-glycerol-3-phosphate acyltransferase [Rhodocyclales bacterium]
MIEIEAVEPALLGLDNGLLVANHVSFVDIFAINALLPAGFVAKSDVAGWPLIGWMSRHNDTVFIERGSRKAAHHTQQQMLSILASGRRLAIFPEGTTTAGEGVLPFHGALFQAAIDAGASVTALAIEYVDAKGCLTAAPAYIGDVSLLDCLLNIIGSNGIRVRITLAARFAPPLQDRRRLAHHAHQAVAAALRTRRSSELPKSLRNTAAIIA